MQPDRSVNLLTVNGYARIRANQRTGRTTYTFIRVGRVGEMISPIIDLFRLKEQHIGGACRYTKVTPFTSLDVNIYCTNYFRHIKQRLLMESML